jgi:hypothetical protein
MLYACIQKFDVTVIVIFFETKQGFSSLKKLLSVLKQAFVVYPFLKLYSYPKKTVFLYLWTLIQNKIPPEKS